MLMVQVPVMGGRAIRDDGKRGVCVGVWIMRWRRWRGGKLEKASLICLQANDVSIRKGLGVPEYTKLCGKIQMEIGTGATLVLHASIATARVQCTVAAPVPRAAGAKVEDVRYHYRHRYRFCDLGLPYLCAAQLYRCRVMDEDPIREIDKQVPTSQRAAVYLNCSVAASTYTASTFNKGTELEVPAFF